MASRTCSSDSESSAEERVVTRRGGWTAYVPFASGYPYGLRVVPTSDAQRLVDLSPTDRRSLAEILVDVVSRYDTLFPETVARTAEADGGELSDAYHRLFRIWFACGVPAFLAILVIVWLIAWLIAWLIVFY